MKKNFTLKLKQEIYMKFFIYKMFKDVEIMHKKQVINF